jgi:hypothetical protein
VNTAATSLALTIGPKRDVAPGTYAYGILAKRARKIYLAMAGRSKVGFSVVDRTVDGRPVSVRPPIP